MTDMVTRIGGKRRQHLYLAEWREHLNLSPQKVADRLGVSRETVWRWENEQHRLNPEKIAALADAYDIEPEQFWRLPTRPSIDAMVKDQDQNTHETAVDLIRSLVKRRKAS